MSVSDHGLEAIRKSTVAMSAAEYQLRTTAGDSLLGGVTFDAYTVEYPSTTQEIIKLRTGGIAGTIVRTITINYTDATKNYESNVAAV
jgi:hypothetical protein